MYLNRKRYTVYLNRKRYTVKAKPETQYKKIQKYYLVPVLGFFSRIVDPLTESRTLNPKP